MVAVEVLAVAPVVHAVVRRRVEHLLAGAERADGVGVDPVLVQQVHAAGLLDERRADADARHQPVGQVHAEHVGHRLPQRGGEVVALARVVHDVVRPQRAHLVHEPVVPVVDEVPADDGEHGRHRSPAEVVALALLPHALGLGAARRPTPTPPPRPAPMATGPVTRRTFRASRRTSRPRPCGMSWSSTTRSRGSTGSSSSWPASTVGDRGDRRRAHRHADEHVAGSGLARHHAAHERTGGERHQQRRHAHGEARDGVVLRVVGGAGSDLVGAPLEVAALRLHRPEVEGDGDDGEVGGHVCNLPPPPRAGSGGSVRRWRSGRAGCCPSTI